jgi:hypothetical protein
VVSSLIIVRKRDKQVEVGGVRGVSVGEEFTLGRNVHPTKEIMPDITKW